VNHFRTLSFAIALLVTVPVQADELSNLVNRVPSDMNTVAIINVREINKSPGPSVRNGGTTKSPSTWPERLRFHRGSQRSSSVRTCIMK